MGDELSSITCFVCHGAGCPKCESTGRIFWVGGYAFPYTPEGEKRAERVRDAMLHNMFVKH